MIIFTFGAFGLISALVLIILVGVKTIEWNWLTGYFLGTLAAVATLTILNLATIKLIKTENYYFYYFFYVLRLGIYVAPFLCAFLIPSNIFAWQGVLIGFGPILLLPFFKNWLIKSRENSKTK